MVNQQTIPPPPPPSALPPPQATPSLPPAAAPKSRTPWIIAVAVVVAALALGAIFWVATSRSSSAHVEKMETSLSELRASIESAEDSLSHVRSAAADLTEQATASEDSAGLKLAEEAEGAALEAEIALGEAREILTQAESESQPSEEDVAKVQETADALESLTVELEEVAASIEATTEALKAAPKEIDPVEPVEEPEPSPPGCVAPVEGAYPCAGGPIPADAIPLPGGPPYEGAQENVASFVTPSGNIWCSVGASMAVCIVYSWDATALPEYNVASGGVGGVTLMDSGPAHTDVYSGAPFGASGMEAENHPIAYGTVHYFGDFVFASEENGLTFWNANSGYGALVNKSGFYPFGPN